MVVTREYSITICDECIKLQGQMCNTPNCIFCWKTMEEVGEYLNALLIRPVVDDVRFDESYAFSLGKIQEK